MHPSSVEASDILVYDNLGNLAPWSGSITRRNGYIGDDRLWEITLSDIASNHIHPTNSRTKISISDNIMEDAAGNGNSAKTFVFKFDVVQPTLVISAQ
ncbi:uncharacterized protein METZ01_LOCUS401786, partial [marine metagenome]